MPRSARQDLSSSDWYAPSDRIRATLRAKVFQRCDLLARFQMIGGNGRRLACARFLLDYGTSKAGAVAYSALNLSALIDYPPCNRDGCPPSQYDS